MVPTYWLVPQVGGQAGSVSRAADHRIGVDRIFLAVVADEMVGHAAACFDKSAYKESVRSGLPEAARRPSAPLFSTPPLIRMAPNAGSILSLLEALRSPSHASPHGLRPPAYRDMERAGCSPRSRSVAAAARALSFGRSTRARTWPAGTFEAIIASSYDNLLQYPSGDYHSPFAALTMDA